MFSNPLLDLLIARLTLDVRFSSVESDQKNIIPNQQALDCDYGVLLICEICTQYLMICNPTDQDKAQLRAEIQYKITKFPERIVAKELLERLLKSEYLALAALQSVGP